MQLLHNGPVVLLGVAFLFHALKNKVHRCFQKLVNQKYLLKTTLGAALMHCDILLSQIARSTVNLTFLVLKALLLLVYVLSYVL
jgi:hypothetical protein